MLGAWAEQTERVQIGALVTGGGYRNPDLLADMARTIDHMSGGRLIFGIGGGWFERDYDEYGYEFGTPGTRLRLLGRNLERITDRWTRLNPAPTRPIPVLIGGGGERKTLRLVAGTPPSGTPSAARTPRLARPDPGRALRGGRPRPGEIERSTQVPHGGAGPADALLNLGVTLFTIGVSGPDYDLSSVPEWVNWRNARNLDRRR